MSARPFAENEFAVLSAYFAAASRTRDRLLLVLGCGTGFRIQELLSLTVAQVWDGQAVAKEVTVARRDLKGGTGAYRRSVKSRRVPLSDATRAVIAEHLREMGTVHPCDHLFAAGKNRQRGIDRSQAFRILNAAAAACGIDATRISTHSLRKTFAARVFAASGHDLIKTQRIMGHSSPLVTAAYLETDNAELDQLVLAVSA